MLRRERALWRSGLSHVAGVDEVGMGPLAGPVVAAAVVLPRNVAVPGVRDSKLQNLSLTAQEQSDLVAFLGTLTSAPLPPALLVDTSVP